MKTKYWFLTDDEDGERLMVGLQFGIVSEKSLWIDSDSYKNIKISKELGAKIQDLNAVVGMISENMTFEQVKAVPGNECFESGNYGNTLIVYEWYDLKENNIEIEFNSDMKITDIGKVSESY